jgi:hypothetical protein
MSGTLVLPNSVALVSIMRCASTAVREEAIAQFEAADRLAADERCELDCRFVVKLVRPRKSRRHGRQRANVAWPADASGGHCGNRKPSGRRFPDIVLPA